MVNTFFVVVIVTPIESCNDCQELIRLKFGMRSPYDQESNYTPMGVVFPLATSTVVSLPRTNQVGIYHVVSKPQEKRLDTDREPLHRCEPKQIHPDIISPPEVNLAPDKPQEGKKMHMINYHSADVILSRYMQTLVRISHMRPKNVHS